ncbi:aspartyl protease family protein [uncultured Winogradskyella sp.]|uniref:aspartyl protease family protein n=1 Tax=uncultured Winogradskyella sp. TaxID=395353 RepID=UPI0026212DBC|nr:aspartyl protease family protein [uncultured Winogradskyella sp.]
MNIRFKYIIPLVTLFFCFLLQGQNSFNLPVAKSSKIRFQLINNIIVMPVELNGVKLSFVLDTGVSRPILFNLVNMDSLQIKNTERAYLRGLGSNGTIQAVRSKGNIIKIGEAIAVNRDVSMVFDPSINFTPRLGVPVHGIIGYDVFKDFIVEVNYSSKYIRLYKSRFFKMKKSSKWKNLPIEVIDKKPYINGSVSLNSNEIPVKLLMDTGSSDALWLFEKSHEHIKVPKERYFEDFLGKGLSGPVYGMRSKVESFNLASFSLERVNVAFPDSIYLSIARNFKARNGSVSGNILKRFNMFFDYKGGNLWIKKNSKFKSNFYYNNSGITLEQSGFRVVKEKFRKNNFDAYGSQGLDGTQGVDLIDTYRYALKPSFRIVELRESSNAKAAGVEIGDIVLSVNNKETSSLSLQEVNKFFYNKKGTVLRIRVERNGKILSFRFRLDDVFKKKSPQIEGSN